jgi:hypothetical protein
MHRLATASRKAAWCVLQPIYRRCVMGTTQTPSQYKVASGKKPLYFENLTIAERVENIQDLIENWKECFGYFRGFKSIREWNSWCDRDQSWEIQNISMARVHSNVRDDGSVIRLAWYEGQIDKPSVSSMRRSALFVTRDGELFCWSAFFRPIEKRFSLLPVMVAESSRIVLADEALLAKVVENASVAYQVEGVILSAGQAAIEQRRKAKQDLQDALGAHRALVKRVRPR